MIKTEMTTAILDAKKRKKATWAEIAKSAGLSEV
jgi:cyanate lyase